MNFAGRINGTYEARDGPIALLLRKLAREATIFALLGMLVAAIGVFVYMDNEDRTNAKRQAAIAVHRGIDFSDALVLVPPVKPAPTVRVPLTNGTVLQVRRCASPVKEDRMLDAFDQLVTLRIVEPSPVIRWTFVPPFR